MASYNNAQYTYAQVLAGNGYYAMDGDLRYSAGVYVMQAKLNTLGYTHVAPDGKFGEETDKAVRYFQTVQGLSADGKAGSATLTKLDAIAVKVGTVSSTAVTKRKNIVSEAEYWEGRIPYCRNSVISTQILDKNNPPAYMDCSDFSSSVYLTKLGINIGINTAAQIKRGVSIAKELMMPGDLIFIDWTGDGTVDHVGICTVAGEMIHEHGNNTNPNSFVADENVEHQALTKYYLDKIKDVRRIIQNDGTIRN